MFSRLNFIWAAVQEPFHRLRFSGVVVLLCTIFQEMTGASALAARHQERICLRFAAMSRFIGSVYILAFGKKNRGWKGRRLEILELKLAMHSNIRFVLDLNC